MPACDGQGSHGQTDRHRTLGCAALALHRCRAVKDGFVAPSGESTSSNLCSFILLAYRIFSNSHFTVNEAYIRYRKVIVRIGKTLYMSRFNYLHEN